MRRYKALFFKIHRLIWPCISFITQKNKPFLFRIFLFLSLFFPLSSLAQSTQVQISGAYENQPLTQILTEWENTYSIKISYQHKVVEGLRVSASINDLSLSQALDQLLAQTELVYKVLKGNEVLIRKLTKRELKEQFEWYGRVIDSKTGEALAFASIVYGENKGTETNENGQFSINCTLATAPKEIKASYLGYKSKVVPVGKTVQSRDIVILLVPEIEEISEVTITEKEPTFSQDKSNGSTSLNVDKLNTLPAFVGGNDPIRNLQLLPGIGAYDDLSSELKVRGSDGDANMVILDGIPLYHVSHYFGIFSAINPEVANKIKLYKNVFPVKYGGRTASVVDITSHDLQQRKIGGSAELNLLTTSAYLELPISPKAALMIGGRITNRNVANTKLFSLLNQTSRATNFLNQDNSNEVQLNVEPNFQFYDFNAKLRWDLSLKTQLLLSFFTGSDQFDYAIERDFSRQEFVSEKVRYEEVANWKNTGASFQIQHQWSEQFTSNFAYSNSSLQHENNLSSSYEISRPLLNRVNSRTAAQNNNNQVSGMELRLENEWAFAKDQLIRFGGHYIKNETKTNLQLQDSSLLNINDNIGEQFAFFGQYRATILDKLELSLGLRPVYYKPLENVFWSPRASLAFSLTKKVYLKAAWSRYYQFLRRVNHETFFGRQYDFWVLANDSPVPLSSAQNSMVGLSWRNADFEFDIEFYQKDIDNVLEHAWVTVISSTDTVGGFRFFKGTGRVKGMDVLFKKTSGKYTGWLAYTLSKSTRQFPEIVNGVAFPAPEDRRHQLKWINQYSWKRWNFSLVYVYSTGQPFTDFRLIARTNGNRTTLRPIDRISYLDDYHRIDLGLNYSFSVIGQKGVLGISLFNVLNRQNVKYRQNVFLIRPNPQENPAKPIQLFSTEVQMLGLTPNVSFRIEFGEN